MRHYNVKNELQIEQTRTKNLPIKEIGDNLDEKEVETR